MASQNEPSMQPESNQYFEEWGVEVNHQVFVLNEKQYQVLKDAMTGGNRGVVFFDKFSISIAHVSSSWLISRTPKNSLMAGEKEVQVLTTEERARGRQKIAEIRRKLGSKLHLVNIEK